MKMKEKSCGTVLYTVKDNMIYYLLIKATDTYCGFPKGHVEAGESEYATAMREVMEETSSRIAIVSDFRSTVTYRPSPGVMKEVVYFLAFTTNADIKAREGEIAEVEWVPLESAEDALTYENDKTVFRAAMERMNKMTTSIK